MKRIISLVLVLVMCMSLVACAQQEVGFKCPACDGPVEAEGQYCSACESTEVKEPADLTGKTIIWNGDSICAGKTETGNWATRIAEKYQMECKNFAAHGATIADGLPPTSTGGARHSVVASLQKMYEEYPDADYIVIEGGTNDADLLGYGKMGTIDPDDFSGNYRVTTFCGALENVFYRAKNMWPGKKIVYIVAQKMGDKQNPIYDMRRTYFDKAIEICEKWDIPYIDLWNDSELDPSDPSMYILGKTAEENMKENIGYYLDGQHLTAKGYDVTTELIEAWLKLQ